MEQLFYSAEIEDSANIDQGTPAKLSAEAKDLACQLVGSKTSEAFIHRTYRDEVTARIQKRLEEKVKTGATITTVVSAGKAQNVTNIMDALRASLKETPKKKVVVDSKMKKAASAKSAR
jgi:non-homologous end joining protein Ku